MGFEVWGVDVLVASSGDALLELLEQYAQIDAVLLDRSPVAKRLDDIVHVVSTHASRPAVLAITGAPDGLGVELSSLRSRMLPKPFEMGDVVEALAVLLGGATDDGVTK
jgi:DNA-binding response OmpR family regulator